MRWTPRVDTSTQMGKAPKWRKCKNQDFFTGSQLYGAKRGRPQYSSLIPFPRCCLFASQVYLTQAPARVGRSGGVREYYGQKRGGKSGLIPFPRCSSPHYHPIPRIRDSSCSSSVTKKDTCYGVNLCMSLPFPSLCMTLHMGHTAWAPKGWKERSQEARNASS